MQVTPISEEAYQEFRKLGRTAVIEWAKTKMDPSIVDRFITTVDAIEKKAN